MVFALVLETGAMARVEVITGPERRRRWSAEQKRAIVAESLAPEAVVAEIARLAEICPGQIYRWRRGLGHANIATTRIYDHRKTRPEDSPTFKVDY
jgi:transposase-like protein